MTPLQQAADRIGREAAELIDDGDRAWYVISGASGTFDHGKNNAVQVVFNVPADADFYGMCLNLYYQYRVIDRADPTQSDRTFRPCIWTSWACTVTDFFGTNEANAGHEGNGTVMIQDDAAGPYQNAAFSVASMYSTPYGIPGGQGSIPMTLYPGALRFHRPYFIGRGKAVTLVYTPLFTSQFNLGLAEDTTLAMQFRVFGLFDGYKKVTAFR